MELLDMKISELLWDTLLDFLRFHAHKTGWGQDTPARVSSPPPTILDMQSDMLLRSIKWSRYSIALLHMKISDILLGPDLEFFRFPKHKIGLGGG